MVEPNIDRVRAALAALNRDGPEAILELLDPNVEWVADRSDMGRVTYRGIEGVRRSFEELYEGFDELGFEADELHEAGDRIVAIGHMYARGRSTGITDRIPLGIVCTAGSDGKLTRYESFRDPNEALEAAGIK
jgi:ketosteroid isomerase-like protein